MTSGLLGAIITPRQRMAAPPGVPWCADNGCYGDGYPGDEAWIDWLSAQALDVGPCVFAVAPDVVGDAGATLERSAPWLAPIRELGLPAALVAQDGLQSLPVPWDEFDVLFIGGSTEWKLGSDARALVLQARRRRKRVHMGRVNSLKRMRYADSIGCQTVDGTFLTYAPDVNLPRLLRYLRSVDDGK